MVTLISIFGERFVFVEAIAIVRNTIVPNEIMITSLLSELYTVTSSVPLGTGKGGSYKTSWYC